MCIGTEFVEESEPFSHLRLVGYAVQLYKLTEKSGMFELV